MRSRRALIAIALTALTVSGALGYGVSDNNADATTTTAPSAGAIAAGNDSNCSPVTDAATSAGSPATLEARATEVSSGTIEGRAWSLWAAKADTGATALSDGGLVLGGREYGLCPGFANPSETEMIDIGQNAIVYGIVGYAGLATVHLSVGTVGSFATGTALPSPHVSVVDGVSFYIGTLPKSGCAYGSLEIDATAASGSSQHNLGFGSCVANEIVPITASMGSWGSDSLGSGATTAPAAAGAGGADANSSCSPTTNAATSGGSPATLEASATEVSSGTIEGQPWSLWAAKGDTGATALEDGGLVWNGREFGLCPGYPNPSETEMIATNGEAIIYGVVGYPGLAKVDLYTGTINSFAAGTPLPSPHVSVVDGVSFYIGTLPRPACSYSYFEVNTTSASVSAEHNIGFGGLGAGDGYAISDNQGNDGTCRPGHLDPLSYSQGIWDLAAGQWTNAAGNSTGPTTAPSPSGPASTSSSASGCSTAVAPAPALRGAKTSFVSITGSPFGVVSSPDSKWAFVASGDSLDVYSLASFTPKLIHSIALPQQTLGIALTPDARYLVAAAGEGAEVIDVAKAEAGSTEALLGTLSSNGTGAIEAAVSPDGRFAFVTLEDSNSLAVFNLQAALDHGFSASDLVGNVPLGEAPVGVTVSANGRYLYATSEQATNSQFGTLTTIDLAKAEVAPASAVITSVPAGCSPVRVVATGKTVYVAARESDEVLAFSAADLLKDPSGAVTDVLHVGEAPVGLVLLNDDQGLVVADSNRFSQAGATANLAFVRISAGGQLHLDGYVASGLFPRDMAITPNGTTLLVSNYESSQLEAVDLTEGT